MVTDWSSKTGFVELRRQLLLRLGERQFLQFDAITDDPLHPLVDSRLAMQLSQKSRARDKFAWDRQCGQLGTPYSYGSFPRSLAIGLSYYNVVNLDRKSVV